MLQNPFVESYASLAFAGPDTLNSHSSGSCSCSSYETAGSTSSLGLSEIYLGSCSEFEFIEAHTSTPYSSPGHDCEAPIPAHSSARSRLTYARSNEYGWVVLNAGVEAPYVSGVPKAPAPAPTSQWRWPIGATIQGIGMEWVVIDNIDQYPPKEEDLVNRTITSPLSGTTYSIHTLIGRGAFAEVVRARTDRGEDVAIKINRKYTMGAVSLKATNPNSYIETDRDLIIQERNILVRIAELSTHTGNAPFLASMHECFQDAAHVYFVMPLYASNIGEHCRLYLSPGIERPRLTRGQIRIWAAELLLGLEALHKLGVVHRDLKPENILITSTGHLAIADFGLSAVFPPSSTTSTAHNQQSHPTQLAATATPFSARRMYEHCGTPGYFAPEVCHAHVEEHGYDASIDIYGFGIILLEMATGTRCAGTSLRAAGRYAAAREFQKNVGAYLDYQFGKGEHVDVDSERGVRDLKNLLKKVLSRVPDNRGTWGELKGHAFFRGVNWAEVGGRRGGAKMPVVDRVKETSYKPRESTGGNGDYSVEFCAESRRA